MNLCHLFSDAVLFWVLQAGLVLFALFAFGKNWILKKTRDESLEKQVNRGEVSMKYFYRTYAAINGFLIAICLSVDAAVVKDHRILFVVVDTAAVAYVCLLNGWFRNYFLGLVLRFASYLSKLEKR